MSTNVGFGLFRPDDGDKGSTFWDELAFHFDWAAVHTHNGTNSALIPATSVTGITETLIIASWLPNPGGTGYYQDVTMPAGMTKATHRILCSDADGAPILAQVNYISGNDFRIIINLNTIDVVVMYVS